MKILMSSHVFWPNLGGLETVSEILAREFVRVGQELVVITQTPGDGRDDDFPFEIVRRPSIHDLMRLTVWADIVFHNNISLQVTWPLLFIRRPWVVAHHIWLPKGRDLRAAKGALKRLVLRKATGIAISHAIASDFSPSCTVIPDPYDDETFRFIPNIERDRDLVFLGRFVSDKGLPDLLNALARLRNEGLTPNLTVIGTGSEEGAWRDLAIELALAEQVHFAGPKRGRALVEELNRHRILVVPSRWNEPFGVVALEGMACGCVVVGSEGGGLGDAIGPGGLTYPNGDITALARCLKTALIDDETVAACRNAAPAHLALHRPVDVAAKYLEVFQNQLRRANNVCGA